MQELATTETVTTQAVSDMDSPLNMQDVYGSRLMQTTHRRALPGKKKKRRWSERIAATASRV